MSNAVVPFAKMRREDNILDSTRYPPYLGVGKERTAVVRLHVQPKARTAWIAGMYGVRLKVRVTAPPTDGRANAECREVLAMALAVSPSSITLIRGATSRTKDFAVSALSPTAVAGLLRTQL